MSDCACLWSGCDEVYHVLVSETRTAVEPLTCEECGQSIVVGQSYDHFEGCDEDEVDEEDEPFEDAAVHRHLTCLPCDEIRRKLYCDGWTYGTLWDDVRDQLFVETGLTITCLDKLETAAAKAHLQQQYLKYLKLD
jgi:hypothetical protein